MIIKGGNKITLKAGDTFLYVVNNRESEIYRAKLFYLRDITPKHSSDYTYSITRTLLIEKRHYNDWLKPFVIIPHTEKRTRNKAAYQI